MSRSKGGDYETEGIYASFTEDLSDPGSWSVATRILEGGSWYPQVIGDPQSRGTDKLSGRAARFFNGGESRWTIVFQSLGGSPGDDPRPQGAHP
jgi:hypothetical protein